MAYSVHQVAKLSGVTIKALYHYHKIGLLPPARVAENGYRYYEDQQLERLQQILFYRELDFSLEQIKAAMDSEPSRLRCLREQLALLRARQQRTGSILQTLEKAIVCTGEHIRFLQRDMELDAVGFAAQARFLLADDFHRGMMESQQTGLGYYLCYAAEHYAGLRV